VRLVCTCNEFRKLIDVGLYSITTWTLLESIWSDLSIPDGAFLIKSMSSDRVDKMTHEFVVIFDELHR
jgi:hypothetical protein